MKQALLQIYVSALSFTLSHSIIRGLFVMEPGYVLTKLKIEEVCSVCPEF